MMSIRKRLPLASLILLAALVGCGDPPEAKPVSDPAATAGGDVHNHPTHGPHKGDLIELGNEEFHAEIVHGDGGEVSVYILDGHAEVAVPIEATEVTINLTHDGNAEQFKLMAVPESNDPQGLSSRFSLKDEELANDLDHEGTAAKLVVSIQGKQYTGKIDHHHDGEAHAH
ncbi:MAG: hypothetical protein R3C01_06665 [Planctomycetaceae bacterium]